MFTRSIGMIGKAATLLDRRQPAFLVFSVTARCNAACPFCFYRERVESADPAGELDTVEVDEISRRSGFIPYLLISGGEPVLREDLADLIGFFVRNAGSAFVTVPSNLAYLGGVLKRSGNHHVIIDSNGLAPHLFSPFKGKFEARGLLPPDAIARIPGDVELIGISCHCTLEHGMTLWLVGEAKRRFPSEPVVVGGYHTTFCIQPFLDGGADFVLQGEGEHRLPMLIDHITRGAPFTLDGIHSPAGLKCDRTLTTTPIEDLPFADFSQTPLRTCWDLHYARGPVRTGRYISIFTSRGCPIACAFCLTPHMWGADGWPRAQAG